MAKIWLVSFFFLFTKILSSQNEMIIRIKLFFRLSNVITLCTCTAKQCIYQTCHTKPPCVSNVYFNCKWVNWLKEKNLMDDMIKSKKKRCENFFVRPMPTISKSSSSENLASFCFFLFNSNESNCLLSWYYYIGRYKIGPISLIRNENLLPIK